jgi:hypothetical protein
VPMRPMEEYESVRTWRSALSREYGGDPLAEEPEKLVALRLFCEFVGEDPDTILGNCFRIRKADGERVISAKWRSFYAEKIKAFRNREDLDDARRSAAAVMGFLIHNGVMLQV